MRTKFLNFLILPLVAFVRRYTNGNIDSLAAVAISNSTTFNGLPNGNYVNLVTGERKPVNNGTLSVSVGEKGSSQCLY